MALVSCPSLANLYPQPWRSMCGCTGNLILAFSPALNLLWRPELSEFLRHDAGQCTVDDQFTRFGSLSPLPRRPIRLAGPVTATAAVDNVKYFSHICEVVAHVVKLALRHFNATEETTTMTNDSKTLGKVVQIDDHRL